MSRILKPIAAVLTLAVAPTAPAQDAARPTTLIQLSVERAPGQDEDAFRTRVAGFGEAAKAVTSCDGALKTAATLKTRVSIRSPFDLSALPVALREDIEARPAGHPTKMFGDLKAVRMLIACPPSFKAPRSLKPAGPPT